jgi:hypothetical protein
MEMLSGFWWGNLKKNTIVVLGINGLIILKCILKNWE